MARSWTTLKEKLALHRCFEQPDAGIRGVPLYGGAIADHHPWDPVDLSKLQTTFLARTAIRKTAAERTVLSHAQCKPLATTSHQHAHRVSAEDKPGL